MDKKKSERITSLSTRRLQSAKGSPKARSTESGKTSTLRSSGNSNDSTPSDKNFPIVGIGASAGGLEAFTQLLGNLPQHTGMAFVLVQHLDPTHKSFLTEILSKEIMKPVKEVKNNMRVKPDMIYVIPPNTDMGISKGVLHLVPRKKERDLYMPIDYFFQSLAKDRMDKAIGVILSGTASDGTLGLKAIKEQGGITFAQDLKTAKFSGMPRTAASSGGVDYVLSPQEIAGELGRISRQFAVLPFEKIKKEEAFPGKVDDLSKLFGLLQQETGVDFSFYKQETIKRRILRRMVVNRIDGLSAYLRFLGEKPTEVGALFHDFLISVTGFFRDPKTFKVLESKVYPNLIKPRKRKEPIRIWVPGCSSGEEAYSIAISLVEFLKKEKASIPIQIFASDIDEAAIEKARSGVFMENIKGHVSPQRLRNFFHSTEGGYKVNKSIRDLCVFARQDVTKDPPYSQMDLISYQNVLIYFKPVLQRRVLSAFHYALKSNGYLVLGSSESIGSSSDFFTLIDKKQKVYAKKSTLFRPSIIYPPSDFMRGSGRIDRKGAGTNLSLESELKKEVDRLLLTQYGANGVVINEHLNILQFRGECGPYLNPVPGEASFNLLKMVREELVYDLRVLLQRAKKGNPISRKSGIRFQASGKMHEVNIVVYAISPISTEDFFLVLFEKPQREGNHLESAITARPDTLKKGKQGEIKREMLKLKQEILANRESLRTLLREKEVANEELQSANEEILSSNEELQSTNEELETTKEELQSTNEELITVNEELQNRIIELNLINDDLSNLLNTIKIPIIMVGNDLRIRRFTPAAERLWKLIPSDVGRPLTDLKPKIKNLNIESHVWEVLDSLAMKEFEVQDEEGFWYKMVIRPYKTMENKLEGAVIALIDINNLKRAFNEANAARRFSQSIIETFREPLVVLDRTFLVKYANHSFYETFKVSRKETQNRSIYELGNRQWDIPKLRKLLQEILPEKKQVTDFKVDHVFENLGSKKMSLNACQVQTENDHDEMIVLAIEDVTEKI